MLQTKSFKLKYFFTVIDIFQKTALDEFGFFQRFDLTKVILVKSTATNMMINSELSEILK